MALSRTTHQRVTQTVGRQRRRKKVIMDWKEFDELYEHYYINDDWMDDYECIKDMDDFRGQFVYDMWQMIKFVKNDPAFEAFREFIETIKAAQQSVQSDGSKREPTVITDFPMKNAYPAGHKPNRRR